MQPDEFKIQIGGDSAIFSSISPISACGKSPIRLADNTTMERHPVLRTFFGYPISIVGIKKGSEINKDTAVAITKDGKQAAVTIRNLARPEEIIRALLKG